MSESKSLLARLLAKENITVQHGNYTTAYFDVQNRILGLPLWKDDDRDLHDMLVGHEVGHALYTPADGWVDMQKAAGDERVPGDYLNVVEDIRIERMIQKTYPGIVRSFKKGYTYLHESDFFGIGDRNINAMSLMDRINLKAKLRDLIDVEFSDVERPLVDRAFAAQTWDEVVAVARELYEFVKSNPESQSQENRTVQQTGDGKEEQNNDDDGQIDPGASTEKEESGSESKTNDQSSDSESDSETDGEDTDSSIEQRTESDSDKEEKKEEYEKSAGETEQDLDQVETIRNAQNNAEELLDTNEEGGAPLVIHGLYRRQMEEIVVPFGMVSAARSVSREKYLQTFKEAYENPEKIYANDEWYERVLKEFKTDAEYRNFMTESKRVVSTMAKEFELRKAAYQYSRASTSRSGSLDLQRLHEYKTSDDIFRRVTTLADAKSHGMVMLIDNSASMAEARGPVIRQVLNLAMFCKQVNIPFDVYSFTNRRGFIDDEDRQENDNFTVYDQPEALHHNNVLMTHVLSSSFNRRTYDRAFRELFDLSQNRRGFEGMYDMMSGTPLQDILSGMHMVLKDFKKKHQIQRPIFTVLTDGESNQLNFKRELLADNREKRRNGVRIILDESRRVLHPKMRMYGIHGEAVTQCLLDGIRAEVPGIRILGYFVANENHEFKSQIYKATGVYDYEVVKEARKVANRNKFVSYDDTLGYDRYFILRAARAADIDATDDEFEVSDKAKRGEITRAFKKYAKSKKGNRVLATQFAEIIS